MQRCELNALLLHKALQWGSGAAVRKGEHGALSLMQLFGAPSVVGVWVGIVAWMLGWRHGWTLGRHHGWTLGWRHGWISGWRHRGSDPESVVLSGLSPCLWFVEGWEKDERR